MPSGKSTPSPRGLASTCELADSLAVGVVGVKRLLAAREGQPTTVGLCIFSASQDQTASLAVVALSNSASDALTCQIFHDIAGASALPAIPGLTVMGAFMRPYLMRIDTPN